MRFKRLSIACYLSVLGPLFLGCGQPHGIAEGTATYNGKAIQYGAISMTPVDPYSGRGAGAKIVSGHYRIAKIAPGKYYAVVDGYADTNDLDGKQGSENITKEDYAKLTVEKQMISPNAIGNTVIVEIELGRQTIDFDLTSKASLQ